MARKVVARARGSPGCSWRRGNIWSNQGNKEWLGTRGYQRRRGRSKRRTRGVNYPAGCEEETVKVGVLEALAVEGVLQGCIRSESNLEQVECACQCVSITCIMSELRGCLPLPRHGPSHHVFIPLTPPAPGRDSVDVTREWAGEALGHLPAPLQTGIAGVMLCAGYPCSRAGCIGGRGHHGRPH